MSWERKRVFGFGFTCGVTFWFGPASNVIIIKIEIGRGRAIVNCFVNHRASSPPDGRRGSRCRRGAAKVSVGGGGSR